MKKKSIQGLIVLMGVTLIGIVVVQYLWIDNAIKVRREQFEVNAFAAIHSAVDRLDREQKTNMFYNALVPKPKRIQSSPIPQLQNNAKADSLLNNPLGQTARRSQYHSIRIQSNGQVSGTMEIDDGSKVRKMVLNDHGVWEESDEMLSNLEEAMGNAKDSIEDVMRRFSDEQREFFKMFRQLSSEFDARFDPLGNRLDMDRLEPILNEELKNRGIPVDFEYGVFDSKTKQLTEFTSEAYDLKKADDRFMVNLFPNSMIRGWAPMYLNIYFNNVEGFIVRSLGILLGASILFTIFILFTFFATIRTILSQKRVSEIKNDFINNMTHEFKTPIATISLATDSINNPAVLSYPERISSFLRIIKEENRRMNNQVERILQMALIEKKDFQLVKIAIDMHEIILNTVDNMELMAQERGGTIVTQLNAQTSNIVGDEIHFSNVIHNLVENAIKYSPEKPDVTIRTQNIKDGIEICVADKGLGLTKEQQTRIFEKFYRASTGNVHNVKGFGLGLSYVKAIMDEHNGSISVKSKVGEGSEFKIFIPFN